MLKEILTVENILTLAGLVTAVGVLSKSAHKAIQSALKPLDQRILGLERFIENRGEKLNNKIASIKRESIRTNILLYIAYGMESEQAAKNALALYEEYLDLGGNFIMYSQINLAFKLAGREKMLRDFLTFREKEGRRIYPKNAVFADGIKERKEEK